MKTRTLAAIIAAVMTLLSICSALPCFALSETDVGYNAEDAAMLRELFETEDAEGVKIGERFNPGVYDPDDIGTWSYVRYEGRNKDNPVTYGVTWEELGGENRAAGLRLKQTNIVGPITIPGCEHLEFVDLIANHITAVDLSACAALKRLSVDNNDLTRIDLSGCPELQTFRCEDNGIGSIDLSCCPELTVVQCGSNALTVLDVSCCPHISWLDCESNNLRKLDLTGCAELVTLDCSGNLLSELDVTDCVSLDVLSTYTYRNRFTEFDLSNNPELYFDRVTAEGNGYIGYVYRNDPDEAFTDSVWANPNPGEEFLGWYNEAGECISTSGTLYGTEGTAAVVTARFTGTQHISGDANGEGTVNAADALIILRAALGLEGDPAAMVYYCDMDGNGVVNAADALVILRIALGLE